MNSTPTKSVPTQPRLCAPGQLQWHSDWWSDFVSICRWVFGKGGYFIGIMISQSRDFIRSIGWIQLQYPKGLDEIWNIPVRWLDASSNSKNRRNHQTEAGGHFLVELSAYLACRAPRLALDVNLPPANGLDISGLWWTQGTSRVWLLTMSSIPCWSFLGLFLKKKLFSGFPGVTKCISTYHLQRLPTHPCTSCCSASLCHHSQSLAWNRLEATVSCLKLCELQSICCRSGMSSYLSNNKISDVGMQKENHDLIWHE